MSAKVGLWVLFAPSYLADAACPEFISRKLVPEEYAYLLLDMGTPV